MAISLVQQTSGQLGTAGTSLSITLPAASTAGNCIVVFFCGNTKSNRLTSISDTGGSTYSALAQVGATGGGEIEIWVALNVKASTSLTLTQPSQKASAIVMEFSGVATASAADGNAATNDTTSSNTHTTPSITTTVNGDLVVAGCGYSVGTGHPMTSSAGWTESTQDLGGIGTSLGAAWIVQSTAGAISDTFTAPSTASTAATAIVALKAAAGASTFNITTQTATVSSSVTVVRSTTLSPILATVATPVTVARKWIGNAILATVATPASTLQKLVKIVNCSATVTTAVTSVQRQADLVIKPAVTTAVTLSKLAKLTINGVVSPRVTVARRTALSALSAAVSMTASVTRLGKLKTALATVATAVTIAISRAIPTSLKPEAPNSIVMARSINISPGSVTGEPNTTLVSTSINSVTVSGVPNTVEISEA